MSHFLGTRSIRISTHYISFYPALIKSQNYGTDNIIDDESDGISKISRRVIVSVAVYQIVSP